MSAPKVDVLAVMRAVTEFGVSAPEWHDMPEACAAVDELIHENQHLRKRREEIDNEAFEYADQLQELAKASRHIRPLLTKYLADHGDDLRDAGIYKPCCRLIDLFDSALARIRDEA